MKGYFNEVEKKVAYSQHQPDRGQKCMSPTVLYLSEDMSHCSVLALEVQDFSQGMMSAWSQSVFLKSL